jgi:hypothetical protein
MRSLCIQAACYDAGKIIFSTSEFPLVEIPLRLLGAIILNYRQEIRLRAGAILMYRKYWIALKNN